MKTVRRIFREFWVPALLGVGWTAWQLWSRAGQQLSLSDVIKTFGPAFFLASWATGQIVRIRRQSHVEDKLGTVENRLGRVAQALEDSAKKIVSNVTGGDSFCYVQPVTYEAGVVGIIHQGAYPLYELQIRIVDLKKFNSQATDSPSFNPLAGSTVLEVPFLHAEMLLMKQAHLSRTWTSLNIFISARNGNWVQMVRRHDSRNSSPISIRVTRRDDKEILFEEGPPEIWSNEPSN